MAGQNAYQMRNRSRQLWLFAFGFLLLLPAIWYWAWVWISKPVRPEDLRTAFKRLVAVPLRRVQKERWLNLTVTIPDDAAWRRIRRHWGDPGYIITAVAPEPKNYLYCLKDLGINVQAMLDREPLSLQTAIHPPYGYSIDCKPAGLVFRAPPGVTIQIHFDVQDGPLRDIDLVVQPYWTVGTKDHLAGISLEQELHIKTVINIIAAAGIITILSAVVLFRRNRVR